MKRLFSHTADGAVELELDIGAATVDVFVEDCARAEITVEPARKGDERAGDLIADAVQRTPETGTMRLAVPRRNAAVLGTNIVVGSAQQVTQVISDAVTITSGGDLVIENGDVAQNPTTQTADGGLRVVARLPLGSSVSVVTDSANLITHDPLESLAFRARSGALQAHDSVRAVRAETVSGDITVIDCHTGDAETISGALQVGAAALLTAKTVSGAVQLSGLDGRASVRTTSGDVSVHAVADSSVSAHTVSGDVRITAVRGATVSAEASSAAGRSSTPGACHV